MPRPPLETVLARVDEHVTLFLGDYGGLPRAVEADQILREIWIEDTHHSTALEGNALSRGQVSRLLAEGQASGPLTDALEVKGYATSARWVYESAQDYRPEGGVPMPVVSQIHSLLVGPAWAVDPPRDGSRPGEWRKGGAVIAGSRVDTAPPIAIGGLMQDWVDRSGCDPTFKHELYHVAELHGWFERIHPFADGNGRAGRLLLNFMLIQRGYPPAVLVATSRDRYLDALGHSDRGNHGPLTELIARAIEVSINRFLIPQLAGDARLVPLGALAQGSGYKADYLRQLAISGKLRATREGRLWLSSRTWLKEYKASRNARGRHSRSA